MKTVEDTINIIIQHYDRPAHHSHKTIAAYGDENGFSSSCWCLLLTNSSVKHSLSIYLLIIIMYFCSYNTGWDEKQVLFTRLIIILFHETHLHLYPK